nr:reverse transcriptase domain-containing protein [Tanacetum cinerariifolium]
MATCHHLSGATWPVNCFIVVTGATTRPSVNEGGQRWQATVNSGAPPLTTSQPPDATWHATSAAMLVCGSHVSVVGSVTLVKWVSLAHVAAMTAANVTKGIKTFYMVRTGDLSVKENREKDKIESKPDKNGKRGEAQKSQKQSQSIKQEKTEENSKRRAVNAKSYKLYLRKKKERSSSKLSRDQTSNPTSSTNPTSKGRIHRSSKQKVENSNFEENPLPLVPMAENQTMAQLLQESTGGACPHHGFSELHQLDTFYNALNVNDQDSLNSAAGGNLLDKMPADCLKIIESKSKVRQTRAKAVVAKQPITVKETLVSALRWLQIRFDLPDFRPFRILKTISIGEIILIQIEVEISTSLTSIKANLTGPSFKEHSKSGSKTDMMAKFMSANTASSLGSGTLPGTEVTNDQVKTSNPQSTAPVQPTVTQSEPETPVSEPVVAPVIASMPNLKLSIPYPSRRDTKRRRDQANEQIEKFYEIFKEMSFEISFTDALMLMPNSLPL